MSEYSERINKQFDEEISKFQMSPPKACDHKTALKLLREFRRDSINFGTEFWPNPVEKYLPAVVEGTMFLGQESFAHKEALEIAIERVNTVTYAEVAHAFIYGVARGVPAYRTALPAYLHIVNIPKHGEEHLSPDSIHTSPCCDFCDYYASSKESKMSFEWINTMQYYRIYEGGYLGFHDPATSSFMLREFIKMPKVRATKEDYQLFVNSLALVEELKDNQKIGAYKEILQKRKILPFKTSEYPLYLDILGYLDILHTGQHHGITRIFIRDEDMQDADENKNYYEYPVRFWRAKNGIDWERVKELFSGVIE